LRSTNRTARFVVLAPELGLGLGLGLGAGLDIEELWDGLGTAEALDDELALEDPLGDELARVRITLIDQLSVMSRWVFWSSGRGSSFKHDSFTCPAASETGIPWVSQRWSESSRLNVVPARAVNSAPQSVSSLLSLAPAKLTCSVMVEPSDCPLT
jgi:hypothetical protein